MGTTTRVRSYTYTKTHTVVYVAWKLQTGFERHVNAQSVSVMSTVNILGTAASEELAKAICVDASPFMQPPTWVESADDDNRWSFYSRTEGAIFGVSRTEYRQSE